jgi:hypothetical protein
MSQSATIYRITEEGFKKLKSAPSDFVPYKTCIDYEVFNQTHEGLQYMLTRGQPEKVRKSFMAIFYPPSLIGGPDTTRIDMGDFDNVDWEAMEEAVAYLTPLEVEEISRILELLDEAFFKSNYNPKEMNKEGIYPGVWGEGYFNYESILEDFINLKQLFKKASQEKNYLLSYVG